MARPVTCQGERAVWRSTRGAAVAAALKAMIEASMVVYIMLKPCLIEKKIRSSGLEATVN